MLTYRCIQLVRDEIEHGHIAELLQRAALGHVLPKRLEQPLVKPHHQAKQELVFAGEVLVDGALADLRPVCDLLYRDRLPLRSRAQPQRCGQDAVFAALKLSLLSTS